MIRVLLVEIGERTAWGAAGGDANLLVSGDGKVLSRAAGASTTATHRKTGRPRSSGRMFVAAQITATGVGVALGINTDLTPLTGANTAVGRSAYSFAIRTDGNKESNAVSLASGLGAFAAGQFMCMAIDFESRSIWFGRATTAGGAITWAGGGNPVTGSVPSYTDATGSILSEGFLQQNPFYIAGTIRQNGNSITLSTDYATWGARIEADLPGYQIWGELFSAATQDYCTATTDVPASVYYPGDITEDGEPVYDRGMSVFPWGGGGTYAPPISGFDLDNTEGQWDFLQVANVRGMPGLLLVGDVNGTRAAMSVGGTIVVDRVQPKGEEAMRIVCGDKLSSMRRVVTPEVYGSTTPNAALAGTRKPFLAGPVSHIPLTPIDLPNQEYQLADSEFMAGPSQLLDAGVVITPGVGWTFGSRADNFGVRRITNVNGRQVATVSGRIGPRGATFLSTPFNSWTLDNPTGWAITAGTETATRRFTQVAGPALGCQSDATGTLRMSYTSGAMIPGERYIYEIVVSAYTSGTVRLGDDSFQTFGVLNRAGTHRGTFVAGGTGALMLSMVAADGACNMTITSLNVIVAEQVPTLTDWITNLLVKRGGLTLADLNTADLTALHGFYPTMGYWTRDAEAAIDVAQRSLDDMLAFLWQDRNGIIRFRRLVAPTDGITPEQWHFTDDDINGVISTDPDLAPNLPPSLNGIRNYSPHRENEIAGSVYVSSPVLAQQLQSEWLANVALTGLHPDYADDARNRSPRGTMIQSTLGMGNTAQLIVSNWRRKRRFFNFDVEMEDNAAYQIEPGDVMRVESDRHGLNVTGPGNPGPGKLMVVVNAASKYTSSLVRIKGWG